jgi:hypothetical protein
VSNRAESDKALLLKLSYTLDRRVKNRGADKSIELAGVLAPISRRDLRVGEAGRVMPLRVRQEQRIKKQVLLNYPENWVVITPVVDRTTANTYGSVEKAYSVGAGQIGIYQQLWLKPVAAPRSALAEFAALTQGAGEGSALSFTDAPIAAGSPPPEPGGPWTLVVGSSPDEAEALNLANRYTRSLSDHGYRVDVLAADTEGTPSFRIVVGVFNTRMELETTRRSLQTEVPFDTWMLELPMSPVLNTAGTPETEY